MKFNQLHKIVFLIAIYSIAIIVPLFAQEPCKEARSLVKNALQLSHDVSKEIEQYRQAADKCPALFEAHYNLGLAYLKTSDYELAKSALNAAAALQSNDIDVRLALAAVDGNLGNLDLARNQYSSILENDGTNVVAMQGLGLILVRLQKVEQGIDLLHKAFLLDSEDPELLGNLALVMEQFERYTDALSYYEKLSKLQPDSSKPYFRQGVIYYKTGQLEASIAPLEKAKQLDYANKQISNLLGLIYYQTQDYDRAELELQNSINLDSTDFNSMLTLSSVHLKQKQPALAKERLIQVLNNNPQEVRALTLLGLVHIELGDMVNAISTLEKARQIKPEDQIILNNLAYANLKTGEKNKARLLWEKVLTFDPNNELAKSNLAKLE